MVSTESGDALVFGSRPHRESCLSATDRGSVLGPLGLLVASTLGQLDPPSLVSRCRQRGCAAACLCVGGDRKEEKGCPSQSPLAPRVPRSLS